jgi:hypothetical protein
MNSLRRAAHLLKAVGAIELAALHVRRRCRVELRERSVVGALRDQAVAQLQDRAHHACRPGPLQVRI